MSDRKIYNIVFPKKGKNRDGMDTMRWVQVGSGIETPRGIKLSIDAIPVDFTGDLMLFPRKPDEKGDPTHVRGVLSSPMDSDDVPF